MVNLNKLKKDLIEKAKKRHGKIFPAGIKTDLMDCFTLCDITNTITFWYNIENDLSTYCIIGPYKK